MTDMAKTKTETQIKFEEKIVTASVELWAAFDAWCAHQGYRTRSEGFRAVMRQVTGFEPGSQAKNPEISGGL